MNITADAVKQLRERTGAGMMECKKALVEANGNLDTAAENMRKAGLAKADKKASRVAAEGVVVIEKSDDGKTGVMQPRDDARLRFALFARHSRSFLSRCCGYPATSTPGGLVGRPRHWIPACAGMTSKSFKTSQTER